MPKKTIEETPLSMDQQLVEFFNPITGEMMWKVAKDMVWFTVIEPASTAGGLRGWRGCAGAVSVCTRRSSMLTRCLFIVIDAAKRPHWRNHKLKVGFGLCRRWESRSPAILFLCPARPMDTDLPLTYPTIITSIVPYYDPSL